MLTGSSRNFTAEYVCNKIHNDAIPVKWCTMRGKKYWLTWNRQDKALSYIEMPGLTIIGKGDDIANQPKIMNSRKIS